jgi:hypothetical protein
LGNDPYFDQNLTVDNYYTLSLKSNSTTFFYLYSWVLKVKRSLHVEIFRTKTTHLLCLLLLLLLLHLDLMQCNSCGTLLLLQLSQP